MAPSSLSAARKMTLKKSKSAMDLLETSFRSLGRSDLSSRPVLEEREESTEERNEQSTSKEDFYDNTVARFRDDEYPMMKGKYYFDHGGTTIYARSLIEAFSAAMMSNLYGNPHSASDPAHLSGQMVDSIREKALRFFNADPEHFDLIFTANATAAIKLVADGFRDLALFTPSKSFWYGFHKDSHTSLVGVRELCNENHHCFGSDEEVEKWLGGNSENTSVKGLGLFAYPGQSNMTGRRLPLHWARKLRDSPYPQIKDIYTLFDAAALATTSALQLKDPDTAPDFTAVSFYKIFGFPDLGALIVRKKSGHILTWRKYFGGGTVDALIVLDGSRVQRKSTSLHDGLEDGTLPFHSILALGTAIDVHAKLFVSMDHISHHTLHLARKLFLAMENLHHFNGNPVCDIYNDVSSSEPYTNPKTQGATIAFNILDSVGNLLPHSVVEETANRHNVFLRAGGLCNPGGVATYLKVEPWQFMRALSAGYKCSVDDDELKSSYGASLGVVRASIGAMTTMADIDVLIKFLVETFVDDGSPIHTTRTSTSSFASCMIKSV